jgi:hypothetical protein
LQACVKMSIISVRTEYLRGTLPIKAMVYRYPFRDPLKYRKWRGRNLAGYVITQWVNSEPPDYARI